MRWLSGSASVRNRVDADPGGHLCYRILYSWANARIWLRARCQLLPLVRSPAAATNGAAAPPLLEYFMRLLRRKVCTEMVCLYDSIGK